MLLNFQINNALISCLSCQVSPHRLILAVAVLLLLQPMTTCLPSQQQSLPQLKVGTLTLLSSTVTIPTQMSLTRTLSVVNYEVVVSLALLEVYIGEKMHYDVYVADMNGTNYKIFFDFASANTSTIYYRTNINCLQHPSASTTSTTLLSTFSLTLPTPTLAISTPNLKSIRTEHPQLSSLSQINKIKCIAFLSGVQISNDFDLNVDVDCDNDFVYIDTIVSAATQVTRMRFDVVVVDVGVAVQMGVAVQIGKVRVAGGTVISRPGVMTDQLNPTQTSFIYGLSSFKMLENTTSILTLSLTSSLPLLEHPYLYLSALSCSSPSEHLNLAKKECSLYYPGFRQECGEMQLNSVRKILINPNTTISQMQIIRIAEYRLGKIIAVARQTLVEVYAVDSTNVFNKIQQFNYGFDVVDVRLSQQPLMLVILTANIVMTLAWQPQQTRFSPYINLLTTHRAVSALISASTDKLVVLCRDHNNSQHLISYSHVRSLATFVLIEDYDMGIISTSAINLIWNYNATRLWVFNSYSHCMLDDVPNNGHFSAGAHPPFIYKNVDDGRSIYAAVDSQANLLVVSIGRWRQGNSSANSEGSLRMYSYDVSSSSYMEYQVLNMQQFYSSTNAAQQVSLSSSGLKLIVQATEGSKKYQLLYRRNSTTLLFQLEDVIRESLHHSFSEKGIAISADAQLIVAPL